MKKWVLFIWILDKPRRTSKLDELLMKCFDRFFQRHPKNRVWACKLRHLILNLLTKEIDSLYLKLILTEGIFP